MSAETVWAGRDHYLTENSLSTQQLYRAPVSDLPRQPSDFFA